MKRLKRAYHRFNSVPENVVAARNSGATYMGGNEVLTRLFNGQKMYVDTRDVSESPHLIIDGYWEINITRVFEGLVEPGDVVFDVGSTYGYYALLAGAGGASRLVCVDPNPVYASYIAQNLTVNGLIDRSDYLPVAIGGKKGTTTLHLLRDDWNSATTQDLAEFKKQRQVPYEVASSEKVDMNTVDGIVAELGITEVGVLKIDIEGQEEAAYKAMAETIRVSPKLRLLIEFSPQNYKDPSAFFDSIAADFPHLYVMPAGDNLQRTHSYTQLVNITNDQWMMLLASKVDVDHLIVED